MIARLVLALVCLLATCSPAAQAGIGTSLRAGVWSSDRLTSDDAPSVTADFWLRGAWSPNPAASFRGEAFIASDPAGRDEAGGDVREAFVRLRTPAAKLEAGRQIFAWGRADRLNPTDIISPRDYRRLVEDDGDDRRGLAALSASTEIAGGTASAHWLPEFRRTELPTPLAAPGLRVLRRAPEEPYRQFALRYERFGARFDWSVSLAQVNDRLPWLALTRTADGPAIAAAHPKLTMFGADAAATWGKVGLRAEAAIYDRDLGSIGAAAARAPRAALALGADRSFPGQLNINVQALARFSENRGDPTGADATLAARNSVVQGAWRDATVGGLVRVRKAFASDRGAFEASGAGFSGGGRYAQLKLNYAVRDGVRLGLIAESFDGPNESLFGRLERNNLIAVTLRRGF